MDKVYCENCGKEVSSNHLDNELEVEVSFICECGFHPNQHTDFINHSLDVDDVRYEIQYCSCCGKSVNDEDYKSQHEDDVDMETGGVFTYCKVSNRNKHW